jgi:hypothetical protein
MIPGSAVFIKHRIMHAGVSSSPSRRYAVLSDRSLRRTLDYGRRVGEFEEKGGIDRTVTPDDLRLEDIKNTLEYGRREGRYEGRGVDKPLAAGEVSGGLFDQNGIVVKSNDDLAAEIKKTGSSLIDSIVTVSREYAAELYMVRKVDFQRVLRSSWTDQVASWGVIDRENVRWVAEFHTDADKSVHVHVQTWDASGAFSGGKDIPYMNILPANDRVRRMIFKETILDKDIDKHYLRELSLAKLRLGLGQKLNESTRARLEQLRFDSSYQSHPVSLSTDLGEAKQSVLTEKMLEALKAFPHSANGYVQFGSLSVERKEAVEDLRKQMIELSPGLRKALGLYRAQVEQTAAFKALKDGWNEKYVVSQVDELNRRLNNVVSKHLGALNSPFLRDPDLQRELAFAQAQISQSALKVGERLGKRMLDSLPQADSRNLGWPLYQVALRNPALKETFDNLVAHTELSLKEGQPVDDAQTVHKQAERIVYRKLTPTLYRKVALSLPQQFSSRVDEDSRRLIKDAVRGKRDILTQQRKQLLSPLLSDREQALLKDNLAILKKEAGLRGSTAQGLSPAGSAALKAARGTIMQNPCIARNLHNQALATAATQNQDYVTSFRDVVAAKSRMIDQQILQEATVRGGQNQSLLSVIALSSLMATGQSSIENARRNRRNRLADRTQSQELESIASRERGIRI